MSAIETPLMRYPGAKFRLRKWHYGFFPPHKVYTEGFAGTASLLFYKKPSITEVINDTNYDVVNLFRVLRDKSKSKELKRLIKYTPYSREEYELCWEPAEDEIEKARRFILRVSMGQRGKLTKSGFDTRVNTDNYSGRVNYLSKLHESIDLFAERLKTVIIEHKCGIEIIDQFDREEALHFVDPEYLNVKKGYPDSFTIDDHKRLADVLNQCKGMIILCGYPSKEYKEWYEDNGWQKHTAKAYADGGFKRVETVWLNPKCSFYQKQQTLFKS
ncbi:DNA adenine methylase [Gracilimonas sediminicola]|uniref:DNA adenine methylase n=1 Tax=Gracilimonas sediminicola TaxID=2952158 RepID=A0A9X2L0G5_9BACT|nr:DNA adenine methylase [Gracilimonas sediminicola]MCP9290030.1 DNA adenine methylase [Gracilimonas sediminicola]